MAANNAYRLREAELSVKRLAVQEAPPPRSNTNQLDSSTSSSRGVHSLVEKIQNGLEVNGSQNLFMFEEQNSHCIFVSSLVSNPVTETSLSCVAAAGAGEGVARL